jgi:RHS repeat-associated protein
LGVVQGHFEYSPFGKITLASGLMPDNFDFRFSSEYFDTETGLVYYNYRYYNPEIGRWMGRDPVNEKGFLIQSIGSSNRYTAINYYVFQGFAKVMNLEMTEKGIIEALSHIRGNQTSNLAKAFNNYKEKISDYKLYNYTSNNPVNEIDFIGLISYKTVSCAITTDYGNNWCQYTCICPPGYLPHMTVRNRCCDEPQTQTCFKPDPLDYLILMGVVALVLVDGPLPFGDILAYGVAGGRLAGAY